MSREQTKRRRKKYNPGSAYAGHVKPTGVLAIFGNVRLFFIGGVLIMLGSLGVGGLFGSGLVGGTGAQHNPDAQGEFVFQDEASDQEADPQVERGQVYTAAPPMAIDPQGTYIATVRTDAGTFEVELLASDAPQTVNSFVFLAQEGFYDGVRFTNVYDGFSAQVGEPSDGSRVAYDLPREESSAYERGTLGMTETGSFFIALSGDQSDVEQFEAFTAFGRVVGGDDVLARIEPGTTVRSVEINES